MALWTPTEDLVVRFSDETGDLRSPGTLGKMVRHVNNIANLYDFNLSSWGGWESIRKMAETEAKLLQQHNATTSDYKIVRGKAAYVERKVQDYIADGYELNGPLQVSDADGTTIFVQGVVKH